MLKVRNPLEIKNNMSVDEINKSKKIRELYIGLGSNLENPISQIQKAIEYISVLDKYNTI